MRLSNAITGGAAALCLAACSTAPAPRPPPSSAEAVVQRQLEAYNAHDLEGFLATYAPEVELFDLPEAAKPTRAGLDAMRQTYGDLFARLPKLHCNVAARTREGPYVVDHEICDIGIPGEPPMRAIAIYQVEDGLIRRVWFAFEE